MRFFTLSICKCCGLFSDDGKENDEAITKQEENCTTIPSSKDIPFESPFRVKEIRQRSVDYIVRSPRFGGSQLPDGTGGTISQSRHKGKENKP